MSRAIFSIAVMGWLGIMSAVSGCDGVPKSKGEAEAPTEIVPAKVEEKPKRKHIRQHLKVEVRELGTFGGQLNIPIVGQPKSLNPIIANESVSNSVLRAIFSTCFSFDYRLQELRPGLCEMVSQNDSGTEFTYTLREGLQWSDGTPITSADIAFSYRVISDPEIASSNRDLFTTRKGKNGFLVLPKLTELDARRFRFSLTEPNQQFHLVASTMPIIPKHLWSELYASGGLIESSKPSSMRFPLVGSGPFYLASYDEKDGFTLFRNPHYWKTDQAGKSLPYLSKVQFRMHRDFMMSLTRFSEGETHLHNVRASEYNTLLRRRSQSNWDLLDLGPSHSTSYFMFNLDPVGKSPAKKSRAYRRQWFHNVRFRKAISYAIDRENLIRNVLWGRGQPLWSYNSPADRRWSTDTVTQYPFDLEKAGALLKRDGFRKRGQRLYDRKGVPVTFTVMTNAENGARVTMLQYIQKDLAKLGITLNVQPIPFVNLLTRVDDTREFDAILLGWAADVPSDPMFSKNVLYSAGQDHLWHPSQQTPSSTWEANIDDLLRRNLASQLYETRKPLMDEIQRIISDKLPQIPLVVEYIAAAADKKVANFEPYALDGGLYWNLDQLFLRTK